MKFNSDGYLDAGFHDLDTGEIEQNFVVAFPSSTTRENIFNGYKKHQSDLQAIGVGCQQYIDGSFVSTKNDPGDIDLVGLMNLDEVDALSPTQQANLKALFDGKATKATHHCDAYYCPILPDTDPRHGRLRNLRKYWMGEFGYDRQDKPKGIIRTIVAPPPPAPRPAAAPASPPGSAGQSNP